MKNNMNNFLVFILGAVVGGVAVWVWMKNEKAKLGAENRVGGSARQSFSASGISGVNTRRQNEKEQNKEKILGMFAAKKEITNDDVENSLGVSDATATNYLNELEQEGKIEQVGQTGRGVFYRAKNG